ncbi:hypothetical protein AN1V17_04340 [Vallitalea sediminicola]
MNKFLILNQNTIIIPKYLSKWYLFPQKSIKKYGLLIHIINFKKMVDFHTCPIGKLLTLIISAKG